MTAFRLPGVKSTRPAGASPRSLTERVKTSGKMIGDSVLGTLVEDPISGDFPTMDEYQRRQGLRQSMGMVSQAEGGTDVAGYDDNYDASQSSWETDPDTGERISPAEAARRRALKATAPTASFTGPNWGNAAARAAVSPVAPVEPAPAPMPARPDLNLDKYSGLQQEQKPDSTLSSVIKAIANAASPGSQSDKPAAELPTTAAYNAAGSVPSPGAKPIENFISQTVQNMRGLNNGAAGYGLGDLQSGTPGKAVGDFVANQVYPNNARDLFTTYAPFAGEAGKLGEAAGKLPGLAADYGRAATEAGHLTIPEQAASRAIAPAADLSGPGLIRGLSPTEGVTSVADVSGGAVDPMQALEYTYNRVKAATEAGGPEAGRAEMQRLQALNSDQVEAERQARLANDKAHFSTTAQANAAQERGLTAQQMQEASQNARAGQTATIPDTAAGINGPGNIPPHDVYPVTPGAPATPPVDPNAPLSLRDRLGVGPAPDRGPLPDRLTMADMGGSGNVPPPTPPGEKLSLSDWADHFVNAPISQRVNGVVNALSPQRIGNEARQIAGLDMSNMLRQGWGTIRHGTDYLSSVRSGVRALTDEGYALQRNDILRNSVGAEHGLQISELPGALSKAGDLSKREEQYAGDLIGNLPGFKQTGRANTLFLNEQRNGVFNVVDGAWQRAGQAAQEGTAGPLQRVSNMLARPGDRDALANYITRNTGRGTLGPLENTWVSDVLGVGFFSPRFQASRIQGPLQMLNVAHPRVAIEAVKDYAASFAATVSLLALANQSGLAKVNLDPTSSDFGQFRFHDTRIDPWAGYRPLAVLTARMLSGHYQDAHRTDQEQLVATFLRGKLAPIPGRGVDVTGYWPGAEAGKDIIGNPVTKTSLAESFLPIFMQGVLQAKDQGLMGEALASLPASTIGLGTNTYAPATSEKRNTTASTLYGGKDYNTLSPTEQVAVNKDIVAHGGNLTEKERLNPYWNATYDDAWNYFKESADKTNPLASMALKYNTIDDWRTGMTKDLRDILKESGQPYGDSAVQAALANVEDKMGFSPIQHALQGLVIQADPDLINVLMDQGYDPRKDLRDLVGAK